MIINKDYQTLTLSSYIKEIDGLRCLAFLFVFCGHSFNIDKGWTGVWIFFVISGFVITRSLLKDHLQYSNWKIAFKNFYMRRALRILPLYLSVVLIVMPVLIFAMGHKEGWPHLWALLTFTYNFYRMDSSYNTLGSIGHLWSLSVEEQFYFIYPAIMLMAGFSRLRLLLAFLIILCPMIRGVVSVIYGDIIPSQPIADIHYWQENAVYLFSPGHFDAFAYGGLIAMFEKQILSMKGVFPFMILIAAAALTFYLAIYAPVYADHKGWIDGAWLAFGTQGNWLPAEIWVFSVVDIISAAILIGIVTKNPVCCLIFGNKIACYIGKISYGAYIWHLPILRFTEKLTKPVLSSWLGHNEASWQVLSANSIMTLLITLGIAHMSFYMFEKRFIDLGRKHLRRLQAAAEPLEATALASASFNG